jgi:hypothetical protein
MRESGFAIDCDILDRNFYCSDHVACSLPSNRRTGNRFGIFCSLHISVDCLRHGPAHDFPNTRRLHSGNTRRSKCSYQRRDRHLRVRPAPLDVTPKPVRGPATPTGLARAKSRVSGTISFPGRRARKLTGASKDPLARLAEEAAQRGACASHFSVTQPKSHLASALQMPKS